MFDDMLEGFDDLLIIGRAAEKLHPARQHGDGAPA
jgi:hypothetical protein